MVKTVITCDICGKEISPEPVTFEICVAGLRMKSRFGNYSQKKISENICKECLKEKGFIIDVKDQEEMEKNTVTLEDKLLDILTDLGVSFVEE